MIHFLVVFNLAEQRLESESQQFDSTDDAVKAFHAAELRHLGRGTHEVVLLGARSIREMRMTHGRYFGEETACAMTAEWS